LAQLKEGSIIQKSTGNEVIATVNDIPTKLSELETDIELGGNFATIGTIKPTDGSMWYQEI
jgi:hypothetical protein